jgi:hypothetical protein
MTPSEKAERAQRLLDDPAMTEAFGDIRMRLVEQMESAPISDVETQHEIALMLQLLKRLHAQLQNYVNDDKLAKHRNDQDSIVERMRQRWHG